MMGEARARAIADIEIRRESQALELGETFNMRRELREDTKRHIEDDRKFLGESGDYWEHFEDGRKWVLHHLSPRFKLCGPTEQTYGGATDNKGPDTSRTIGLWLALTTSRTNLAWKGRTLILGSRTHSALIRDEGTWHGTREG